MYIGRVVTNMKKIDTVDFVERTNKVDSIDQSIPTLIVGKELAESIYGKENIRMLNKKIDKNVYWTFTKLEKRNEFEKDIEAFNTMVIDCLENTVDYFFFNIFYEPISRVKKFITFVSNNEKKIVYVTDKHIYIYYNKHVFGISLEQTRYLGISDEKILNLFKRGKSNVLIDNVDFMSYRMRKRLLGNNIIVPYLYFLKTV